MSDTTTTVFIKADASGVEKGAKKAAQSLDKVKKEGATLGGAFKNLSNITDALNVNFGGMGVNIGMARKAFDGVTTGIKGATVSTRAFTTALAATGITIVVAALAALVKGFTSTQRGADALSRAIEPVKAVFAALWGLVQDFAVDAFERIFEDPKGAVIDLGKAIVNNLMTRVKAIPQFFQAFTDFIAARFSILGNKVRQIVSEIPIIGKGIDVDEVAKSIHESEKVITDSAKRMKDALIQATTGLAPEDIEAGLDKINAKIKEGRDTGRQIAAIEKEIMQARINSTVPLANAQNKLADLMLEARKLKDAGEDTTAVQEQMRDTIAEIAQLERNVLNLELQRLQLKNSLNDTSDEELLQMKQLEAQILNINKAEADRLRSVERFRDTAKQINEEFEKTPEILEHTKEAMIPLEQGTGAMAQNIEQGIAGGLMAMFNAAEDRKGALLKFLAQMAASLAASAIAAAVVQSLFPAGAASAASSGSGVLSMLGNIPKFANGTPFAPGGLSLVGERGPELVNLPQGAKVHTNERTRNMMGGGKSVNVDGQFTIKGSDLVMSLNRTRQRQNR